MKKKIYAMIPARIGSKRLKYKNLALLNNKPLISYVINTTLESKIFDKIFINSDEKFFGDISKRYNIDFYNRPKKLGGSNISSDEVVIDFINKFNSDILVWVNPIAPLQTSSEIKKVLNYFIKNKLNSLITTNKYYVHSLIDDQPINFNFDKKFDKTQDLKPINQMVYSLMIWDTSTFKKFFYKNGFAIMHGKTSFYPVNKLSGYLIKNAEDLFIVEKIILSKKNIKKVKYDKIINKLNK